MVLDQDFLRSMELPAEGSRVYYDAEVPGFCCQVTYTGTATFRFRYRRDGQWYSIKIGRWRDGREPDRGAPLTAKERAMRGVTAGMARKQAEALRTQVDNGANPGLDDQLAKAEQLERLRRADEEAAAKKAEATRRITFAAAVALYFEDAAARGKPLRSGSEKTIRMSLTTHAIPVIGAKALGEITEEDVEAIVRSARTVRMVKGRKIGGEVAGNRVACNIPIILNWAVKKKLLAANPVGSVAGFLKKERPRRRYLSTEEMGALMRALDDHPYWFRVGMRGGGQFGYARLEKPQLRLLVSCEALRVALLTGARKGEVYRMKWTDVDLANGWWHKPPENTKTDEPHEVALGELALASLRRVRESHADPVWVFPGKARMELLTQGKVPEADLGSHVQDVHGLWVALRDKLGFKDVRIHDLRHTHASALISAGATLFDVGAQLGHKQAQTTMRYAHLMKDRKKELARKIDAFAAALPEPA